MRPIALLSVIALLLVLAGTAAYAQCPTPCPQVQKPACPPACPTPKAECPKVCPPPKETSITQCPPKAACPPKCCPTPMSPVAAQCPCPMAMPGALGAGPCADLVGLECADFDRAYTGKLFDQNNAVIALTGIGIERATDKNLRDISGEIRTQLTSENVKLRDWHERMGFGTIPVDYGRVQMIVDSLNEPMGKCFDVAYAQQLIGLLQQSRAAHEMAVQNATVPEVKQQAEFVIRYTDDWIFRLQRWINEKGQVPTA